MSNLPSIATVSLSSPLRAATEPRLRPVYREGGGTDFVADDWRLPTTIPAELIADAKAALPALDAALMPAERQTVERWLVALGTLCAGAITAADARVKVAAYAPMLARAYPPLAFTAASLDRAGRRFKWLPSYAELTALLDEVVQPTRDLRARVERLARATPTEPEPPPRRYAELSPAERDQFDRLMADAKRHLTVA